jgi:hypothetical protein
VTDLVKHLRTVHFVIIITCILVLIPKIGVRPGEVVNAWSQLNSIIAIRNNWNTWTKRFAFEQLDWIRKLGVHWFKFEPEHGYIASEELDAANIRHSPNQGYQLRLNGAPIYFFLNVSDARGSARRFLLAQPRGKLSVSDTFPTDITFPADDSGSQPFKTLQEFRYFWDAARQPRVSFIDAVSPISYLVTGDNITAELQTTQDVKPGGGVELTSRQLGGCREESVNVVTLRVAKDFNELFCRKIEEGILVFPAKIREPRLPINLQQWLIQQFRIDTVSGSFPEAFPELDRVTKVYQELELGKISQILAGELERSGERIQFLGLQLPERIIVTWGMVILFAVQIYFCVQLRTLRLRTSAENFDEARNAGWIGLYRDWGARLVSSLTIGVLPLAVAFLVAFENGEPSWISIIVVIAVGLASLYAGLFAFKLSRR